MAQNGVFRNAMRGFNKQDVLLYIDNITAVWENERRDLEQKLGEATAIQASLRDYADQLKVYATAVTQHRQKAETQLANAQKQLKTTAEDLSVAATTVEELAAQLEEAQQRITQLEEEATTATTARDEAYTATRYVQEHIAAKETALRELEDSRRIIREQNKQIDLMQQSIDRYERTIKEMEAAHQESDNKMRPLIEQANRQADEALTDVQTVLTSVLTQLNVLQSSVDQRRQTIRDNRIEGDTRPTAPRTDYSRPTEERDLLGHHFFR